MWSLHFAWSSFPPPRGKQKQKHVLCFLLYNMCYSVYSPRTELWFGLGVKAASRSKSSIYNFMSDWYTNFLQNSFWLLTFQASFSSTFCTLPVLSDMEHIHMVIQTLDQHLWITIQVSENHELSGSHLLHQDGWLWTTCIHISNLKFNVSPASLPLNWIPLAARRWIVLLRTLHTWPVNTGLGLPLAIRAQKKS